MLNKEINDLFKDFIEKYLLSYEEIWKKNLDKLKKFIDDNKQLPKQSSENHKKLSYWLTLQKTNHKNNKIVNEDIKFLWEDFYEKYKEYFVSNEELWEKHFSNLKKYLDDNQKIPSDTSGIKNESALSNWLFVQKKNYKTNFSLMKDDLFRNKWEIFIEEYKHCVLTGDELWKYNLDKVKKFIDDNQYLPKEKSTIDNEKQLYSWIVHQKHSYKNNNRIMKDENIKILWENFVENYKDLFLSTEDIWKINLDKLKKFIDDNKQLPYRNSKNVEEKFLSTWIVTQRSNYKKQNRTLANPIIKALWEAFVSEYL
jgi:hypothetical protein